MDAEIEKIARRLLKKYNLSEKQMQRTINGIECLCKNIINAYIDDAKVWLGKPRA